MRLGRLFLGCFLMGSALGSSLNVANPALLEQLSSEQRSLLEKNYFFVAPSDFHQIYALYRATEQNGIPILVTPDCILHTFHILTNYALRTTELNYFYKDLERLTEALLDYELRVFKRPLPKGVRAALKKNIAFFSVGASLLISDFKPPTVVKDLVAKELAKIDAHTGFDTSAIFNYLEDYSQYLPRGHYTRNEDFKRYFRALMWYGRMGFYLRPADIELGRSLTRQAVLICDALRNATVGNESALAVWERIYNPTVFFVGKTDDLGIYDYLPVIDSVFGKGDIFEAVADNERLDSFIKKMEKARPPRILSTSVPDTLKPEEITRGLKFIGQRSIPDSYIFQELVYPKVGTRSNPRLFPKGLDVMAVLGSNRAWEILDRVYNETQFLNYREQMIRLKGEFSKLTEKGYEENLYLGWLHILKLLLRNPVGLELPRFMMNPAWPDKCLLSCLGSWVELRHDTILYAKESYTMAITGIPPRPKLLAGYVEPCIEVYKAVGDWAGRTVEVLSRYKILNLELKERLERFASLCTSLKNISLKELKRERPSDDELRLVQNIGKSLEDLVTFTKGSGQTFLSETDEKMAVIADVHTDPNTGQVLEVGVGNPASIYAVIPFEGDNYIARGGVFTYYEFTRDMDERLTDEEWQAMELKPELPVWTKSFMVK